MTIVCMWFCFYVVHLICISDAEKGRTKYQSKLLTTIQSTATVTYPKQIVLTRPSIETCENNEIKAKKPPSFYIDKQNTGSHTFKWVGMLHIQEC